MLDLWHISLAFDGLSISVLIDINRQRSQRIFVVLPQKVKKMQIMPLFHAEKNIILKQKF